MIPQDQHKQPWPRMTIFELDRTMVHIFYFKGIFLDQVQPFSKSFVLYFFFNGWRSFNRGGGLIIPKWRHSTEFIVKITYRLPKGQFQYSNPSHAIVMIGKVDHVSNSIGMLGPVIIVSKICHLPMLLKKTPRIIKNLGLILICKRHRSRYNFTQININCIKNVIFCIPNFIHVKHPLFQSWTSIF